MSGDANGLQLGFLGPLLVRSSGHESRVNSAKQRDVLATLLVRANEIVPIEQLTDIVWDGRPPPTAVATARNYIARLRCILGPDAGGRIITYAPGYLLRVERDELDWLAFAAMCRAGEAAIRQRAWASASETLTGALRLWRGVALIDIGSQSLQRDEVPRFDRQRLQAIEWRIEADLALGRHASLVDELRPLVIAYPLDERFSAHLIVALARCGRRGEALDAYQVARSAIVGCLGVEPGPELQELQRRVLTADTDLIADQRDGVVHVGHVTVVTPPPRQLPAIARRDRHRTGQRSGRGPNRR
jgi:DNA-binding SARP family transcriptional activator